MKFMNSFGNETNAMMYLKKFQEQIEEKVSKKKKSLISRYAKSNIMKKKVPQNDSVFSSN